MTDLPPQRRHEASEEAIHQYYQQKKGRGRPSVVETSPTLPPPLTDEERIASTAEMHRVLGEYRSRLNRTQFNTE